MEICRRMQRVSGWVGLAMAIALLLAGCQATDPTPGSATGGGETTTDRFEILQVRELDDAGDRAADCATVVPDGTPGRVVMP